MHVKGWIYKHTHTQVTHSMEFSQKLSGVHTMKGTQWSVSNYAIHAICSMSNRTPALFTDFLEEPTNVCLCVYTHGYLYVFIDTDGLGVLLRQEPCFCCCLVAQWCLTLWPYGLQHTRLPCPSPSFAISSNSHPLSWWCHPTISSDLHFPFDCSTRFPPYPMLSFHRWSKNQTHRLTITQTLQSSLCNCFSCTSFSHLSLLHYLIILPSSFLLPGPPTSLAILEATSLCC